MKINIYCDESGHLEHDHNPVMVLGAVWCPADYAHQIALDLRKIKQAHGLSHDFEVKWTKVSIGQTEFYRNILEYFFNTPQLHFRALIVPDKSKLCHSAYSQSHDDFYYKMYFDMLKTILNPKDQYRIYLDIKDTQGGSKVAKLHEVLSNNLYDFSRSIIERIQIVRSNEVEQIQLADLLIGVISYANRGLSSNQAKLVLVETMRTLSGYRLTYTTLLREEKVNLFRWHALEEDQQ